MNLSAPDPEEETHITRCGVHYAFILNEEGFTLRRSDGEMVSDEEYADLLAYVQDEGWSAETNGCNREAQVLHNDHQGFPAFKIPPPLVKKPTVPKREGFLRKIVARLFARGRIPLFLACCITILSGTAPAASSQQKWIELEERTIQGILQHEVDEMTQSYHPKRVIMLMMDPRTGVIEGAAASKDGKMLTRAAALREASRFQFDPGAVVDSFTPGELAHCGIRNPTRASASDLLRLFGTVADGGLMKPANRVVIPDVRIEGLRQDLLELVHGKRTPLLLARVDGIRVAGAAGHGGRNPVTACFAGYFPADHPRHVCVVVVEGADTVLKYQRGGWIAAPNFSFAAERVQRLGVTR